MGAAILDGSAIAAAVRAELAEEVATLSQIGITPGLGTILVGDNPASAAYVRLKHQDCEEIGIQSFGEHLPEDTTQDRLLQVIGDYNDNADIDAFLVQLPLPKQLDELQALLAVDPEKDVDGLHPVNLGRLVMGNLGPIACTPAGIVELLVRHGIQIEGQHVVIIGRGLTIGRPLANLLALKREHANAAVTVVHTGVPNWADYAKQAKMSSEHGRAPHGIEAATIWVQPIPRVIPTQSRKMLRLRCGRCSRRRDPNGNVRTRRPYLPRPGSIRPSCSARARRTAAS